MLDGKPLGTYAGIAGSSIVFSSDGKHIAYAVHRNNEWVVVIDGREQRPYEAVGKLALSPDGASLMFIARKGGAPVLVVNGEETAYDEIYELVFSLDSKHWAAIVKQGEQYLVVRDGKKSGGYPGLGTVLVFSPDSSHLAYVVVRGKKAAVALDGELGKEYSAIMQPDMASVRFFNNATVRYLAIEGGALLSVDQTAK